MLRTEHPAWGSGLNLLSTSGWGGLFNHVNYPMALVAESAACEAPRNTHHPQDLPLTNTSSLTCFLSPSTSLSLSFKVSLGVAGLFFPSHGGMEGRELKSTC